jgi:nucleotide-binding universal stress UspA family protein
MGEGAGIAPDDPKKFEEKTREIAQQHVAGIAAAAAQANLHCDTVVHHSDTPHEEIIRVAKETGCDTIVMASHGRKGISKLLLGSETQKVLTYSDLPVLVVR